MDPVKAGEMGWKLILFLFNVTRRGGGWCGWPNHVLISNTSTRTDDNIRSSELLGRESVVVVKLRRAAFLSG